MDKYISADGVFVLITSGAPHLLDMVFTVTKASSSYGIYTLPSRQKPVTDIIRSVVPHFQRKCTVFHIPDRSFLLLVHEDDVEDSVEYCFDIDDLQQITRLLWTEFGL